MTQQPTQEPHVEFPPHLKGASPDEAAAEWLRRLDEALKKLEARG